MNTINRYIDNQRNYIAQKKEQPLIGFTNNQGEPASWRDIAVTFTDSDNKSMNIIFCKKNRKAAKIGTTFTESDRLAPESHDLLFAYALDIISTNTSIQTKSLKITTARNFLSILEGNVGTTSLEKAQQAINSMTNNSSLTSFISWLHQHKMIPKTFRPYTGKSLVSSSRSKSGDDALEAEKSKLPSEKALLALGSIFYDVIPPYQDGNKKSIKAWQSLMSTKQEQRDSFVCTMLALGMASPNRIGAEQVLLTVQRIKRYKQVVDNQEKTVHYLNWRGSKGFKDYQNHINAEMVESLDRALHYTALVTEPARALARFYQKPNRPLKEVLGDFKPSDENMTLLSPSMEKSTNLLYLGLLLGFFDESDKCVRVHPSTKGAINLTARNCMFIKPIAQLEMNDILLFASGCSYAKVLTGSNFILNSQYLKYTAGKQELTLSAFQKHTIDINRSQLRGYNQRQTKSVNFENALFAYTEKQFGGRVRHPFLLIPISSLSGYFTDDLIKQKKLRLTIFERHGFASSFKLKPHQLRHWQNNYLSKKGLPHHLITILSGRRSAEQTLTYIHTTDAQNSSVIGDISYSNTLRDDIENKVMKRIVTMNEFNEAIDNHTPTFIHETGFCTQNLALSPCTYMSNFETQCTLCQHSCHVTQDRKAIDLLKKDLRVQSFNLEQVQKAVNFETSSSMHKWYKAHYSNTCMLKSLIEVLSDENIEAGSMVRLLTNSSSLRITNLKTKIVEEKKLSLPNADQALQKAIEAKKNRSTNEATRNFITFLGSL